MANCLVCNFADRQAVCPNCGWPGNMTDGASLQMAIGWAAHMYRKVLKLEAELGRPPTKPFSDMNVQLAEPTELVEPWRAEIKSVHTGMETISKEQNEQTVKLGQLFERLQGLERILQEQQQQSVLLQQQQSAETEKIYSQQRDLYKVANQHTKLINQIMGTTPPPQTPLFQQPAAVTAALPTPTISPERSAVGEVPVNTAPDRSAQADEASIVAEYNQNPQDLPLAWREQFMSVSIDSEAFARLRDGDDSNIVFNRDRKGNYLILPYGGAHYLVPNKQRKIISQIYITTQAIYDCAGYSESYREFQLVKPAWVAEGTTGCWRLIRKGILQFG
jgi:riboflavin biosynthesis pyrimidine reductase